MPRARWRVGRERPRIVTSDGREREVLLLLARALAGGRRAWIRYDDAGGSRTDREVDVLGLAWRAGSWLAAA